MASDRKQRIAKATQSKVFRIVSNTASTFILIVSIVICALVVISAKSTTGAPNFLGYSFLSVRSGSMRPIFDMGDLIVVKRYDVLHEYKEGDIITFKVADRDFINTHTIVRVIKDQHSVCYETQGEANAEPDEDYVMPRNILGLYTGKRVAGLGKAFEWAQTSKGVLVTVVIPAAIIVVWQLFNYLMFLSDRKNPQPVAQPAAAQPAPQIYPPAAVDKDEVIREYLEQQRQEERKRQQIIDEYLAKQKELEQAEKEKAEEAKIKAIIAEFLAQQQALGNDPNKQPDDPNKQPDDQNKQSDDPNNQNSQKSS